MNHLHLLNSPSALCTSLMNRYSHSEAQNNPFRQLAQIIITIATDSLSHMRRPFKWVPDPTRKANNFQTLLKYLCLAVMLHGPLSMNQSIYRSVVYK